MTDADVENGPTNPRASHASQDDVQIEANGQTAAAPAHTRRPRFLELWNNSTQQLSRRPGRYTSSAFDKVSTEPMPVGNVILGVRPIIITKLMIKALILELIFIFLLYGGLAIVLITPILLKSGSLVFSNSERAQLLWKGYKRSLLVGFTDVPAKFWEHVVSRVLLNGEKRAVLWWEVYIYLAGDDVFRANYIEAWKEHEESDNPNPGSLTLFSGEESVSMPISLDAPTAIQDTVLAPRLMQFFNLLRLKRGLSELIIPKILHRVDCVEMVDRSGVDSLGEFIESLKLGKRLSNFKSPLPDQTTISDQLVSVKRRHSSFGLDFVREFDRTAFAGVIIIPPAASLIFAIVWVSVFLGRQKDPQVTIGTAFTVASYLVTAGALFTALVAYFDKKIDEDEPKAMLKEVLTQLRSPENAQPSTIAHPDQLSLILEQLKTVVSKLSTPDEKKSAVDSVCAEIKDGFEAQTAAIAKQAAALASLNESINNMARQQKNDATSLEAAVNKRPSAQSIDDLQAQMRDVLSVQSNTADLIHDSVLRKPKVGGEDVQEPSTTSDASNRQVEGVEGLQ